MSLYALLYDYPTPSHSGSLSYFVVPIGGLGTAGSPYRAITPSLPSESAMIPSNPDGTPKNTWGLLASDVSDTTRLQNALGVIQLPGLSDTNISQLILNDIELLTGVDMTGVVSGEDIIMRLGTYLESEFSPDQILGSPVPETEVIE